MCEIYSWIYVELVYILQTNETPLRNRWSVASPAIRVLNMSLG